jgi:hypothetical protein
VRVLGAHTSVQWVRVLGAKLRKFLSQMEREHVIPFAVGAGTGCVYLEPTQVYIAHAL